MSMAEPPVPSAVAGLSGRAALRALPGMLRRMLPMLVLDAICPLVLYLLVRPYFTPTSAVPLAVAVLFPLLANLVSLVRRRRLDTFGVLVLLSLLASLAVLALGTDARVLLVTRDLVMPLMGLACLVSLLFPKPLAFYMVRQFTTGDDPQLGAGFDRFWQHRSVRQASRLMSLVWGLAMLGEFVVRIGLVLTLPVVQVLVISPVVMMAVGLGLGVWNLAYGLRVYRQVRRLPSPSMQPAQPPLVARTEA
jgi:hypothetical protein